MARAIDGNELLDIERMEETIQDAEGLLDKCSPALKEEVLEQNEVFKIAISALRSVSREQVEMAWRGEWGIGGTEMTDREKMIDLIINAKKSYPETGSFTEYLADFLLGYGIKLPDPTPQPGKPLTLEQLREMDGQPVWCEDVGKWALVSVDNVGEWKGVPFALFEKNGGRFEWNVEDRELFLYSYPPTHIDRSKWEGCENCKEECWNCENNTFVGEGIPEECEDCVNKSKWIYRYSNNYCPYCGRPLTEEAWAELERRLRG